MKAFNPRYIATLCAAVILLGVAQPSKATQLITFNFEGRLFDNSVFGFGNMLNGWYTFDADTMDSNPSSEVGMYDDAIVTMNIEIGGLTASAAGTDLGLHRDIMVLTPSTFYRYSISHVDVTGNVILDTSLLGVDFSFDSTDNIPSDALPTVPPPPDTSQGANNMGRLAVFQDNQQIDAFFQVTSLTLRAVPEPATAGLLGIALIGVVAGVRRKKSYRLN